MVDQWCNDNDMFINTDKTKFMVIGTKQKLLPQYNDIELILNSAILQNSTCEKLLGVKIDPTFSWTLQINHICLYLFTF